MSVQSEINSRTQRLEVILADSNTAITAKSGVPTANLSGLPAAIESIPKGESDAIPDTTAIDYSAWDSGTFTETLETGDVLTYTVAFDDSGQPTQITAPDGTTTAIDWGTA